MKTHCKQRIRRHRQCRGSAAGVGSRCGVKEGRIKDDGLPTEADIRFLRKRLGFHSRQAHCGRPAPYRPPPRPEAREPDPRPEEP
jgi:hypothetical protein